VASRTAYRLTIGGTPATAEVLAAVKKIEIEDHASMADMMKLHLGVAVRENGNGWTVLDDDLFHRLVDLRVTVTVGTGPAMPLIEAYVVHVDTTFSNDPGSSELVVTAMDPTVLMHLEEKVKTWPNMMDSDVASAIFSDGAYRFTPVVDSTQWSRQENDHTLTQRGTDIQFLQHLAERNGYECFVALNDAGVVEGHFHKPKADAPPQGVLTVNMGSATNVNSFQAKFDMIAPSVAKAATIDPDDASGQTADSSQAEQADTMGGSSATPTDRPRTVLLSGLAMAQSGEVQRYAQSVVDWSSWSIVAEGTLDTVAYAKVLRAKQPVMVRGVGQQFSGRYYVERVLHTISSDGTWTQNFSVRRNATGLTRRENFRSDDAVAS
jgi:phage protein D